MLLNNDDYYYRSIFLEMIGSIEEYDPDNLLVLAYKDKEIDKLDKFELGLVKETLRLERLFGNNISSERKPFAAVRRSAPHEEKMFWLDDDVVPALALCRWEDKDKDRERDRLYKQLLTKLNPAYIISYYSAENDHDHELLTVVNLHILYVDQRKKLKHVHIHDYTGFNLDKLVDTLEPDFDTFVLTIPSGYHPDWNSNDVVDDFFNSIREFTDYNCNSLWSYIDCNFDTDDMEAEDIDYIEEQVTFMLDARNIDKITKETLDTAIQSYVDEFKEKGHMIPEGYKIVPAVDVEVKEEEDDGGTN